MNRTRNRTRIAAAVVLAGAVLGTTGSGAAQAAAGDGPAGGLVGMLGIGSGGGGGDQVSSTVSGNSSVADIGGRTTEQSTS